jgi:hypothetical protein
MSLHSHEFKTDELSVVVGDNEADGRHEAGYSGIWSLTSVHDSRPFFLPNYAGFNFEFIVPMREHGVYEPRHHPTELTVDDDGRQATVHQTPTPEHRVESWTTFRPTGPSHLDWTFRYRLEQPELFPTGFAGFFFASYICEPENKSIYLLTRDVYDSLMWSQFCTTHQGRNSAVVWEEDPYDLTFGSHEHGLYSSQADIRYHVPLMLGRRGEMAFVIMFEKPQGVVISHGMGGGGFVSDQTDRNPAWDFFLYAKDPAASREGEWKGRIVYKKFIDRYDILRENQRFQKSLGRDWLIPKFGPQK